MPNKGRILPDGLTCTGWPIWSRTTFCWLQIESCVLVKEVDTMMELWIWCQQTVFLDQMGHSVVYSHLLQEGKVGDSGKPCVFPFRFEGKIYNSCTTDGSGGRKVPWCATRTNPTTGHTIASFKGDCRSTLKIVCKFSVGVHTELANKVFSRLRELTPGPEAGSRNITQHRNTRQPVFGHLCIFWNLLYNVIH